MNSHKSHKIFFAAFTVFTFFITSLGISPSVFASAAMPEVSFPYQLAIDRNLGFAIPQKLGKLEYFSAGQGGRPVVFHVQTAHGHYQAQQQIRQILHYLDNHYGVRTLLVEGSAFQLDPKVLNFFPQDKALTGKVNDALTKQAIVKGPELYLLEANGAKAYGIEDLPAYRENGVSFASVLEEKQKTGQFLADMNMKIERFSSHFLNKDLRDFLRRVENFEKNQVPLDTWLASLRREAQKRLEIDLALPAYQHDWPMMVRLSKIQELSQKLDRGAFLKERDAFLKAIQRFLPVTGKQITKNDPFLVPHSAFTAIESLLRSDSMSQPLPDPETSLLFEDMVRRLPENFNYDAFPNVCYYIGTLLLQSELKADRLMLEARKLTDTIAEKLTRNPGEKKLIALLEDHRLLQKLFALELTPADHEAILKGRKTDRKPSLLVSKMQNAARAAEGVARTKDIQCSHLADLDELFDKAMKFYGGVKERDALMLKRVEDRMKETGADRVAVITGGFHAQPFKDYFSGKDYTYALISPALAGADEAGYQAYIQNMLRSVRQITSQTKNKSLGNSSGSVKSGLLTTNEATHETVFPSDRKVLSPQNPYGLNQPALREMVRSVIRSVAGGAMPVRSGTRSIGEEDSLAIEELFGFFDGANLGRNRENGDLEDFSLGMDGPESRTEPLDAHVKRQEFRSEARGFFDLAAGRRQVLEVLPFAQFRIYNFKGGTNTLDLLAHLSRPELEALKTFMEREKYQGIHVSPYWVDFDLVRKWIRADFKDIPELAINRSPTGNVLRIFPSAFAFLVPEIVKNSDKKIVAEDVKPNTSLDELLAEPEREALIQSVAKRFDVVLEPEETTSGKLTTVECLVDLVIAKMRTKGEFGGRSEMRDRERSESTMETATVAERRESFVDELVRVKLVEAGYVLVQHTLDERGLHLTIRRDPSIPEDALSLVSTMLSYQFRQRFPGQQLYLNVQRSEPKTVLPSLRRSFGTAPIVRSGIQSGTDEVLPAQTPEVLRLQIQEAMDAIIDKFKQLETRVTNEHLTEAGTALHQWASIQDGAQRVQLLVKAKRELEAFLQNVAERIARSESRANQPLSKGLRLMPMEELVASEALKSWRKLPGDTHRRILAEYSRVEGRYRFAVVQTLNTPYKWAIKVQESKTLRKIAELFLQTDRQHPNLELVDYRAKADFKEPVKIHVATEPALALTVVSEGTHGWPRIEVVFPDTVAKKFKGQVPEGLPIRIVPESEAVRRSESRVALYPAAGDVTSMIRELYQQEPWLAKATQKLRFGVVALRIMDALKQTGASGLRVIERLSGISLANAAETASIRQKAVTLASRPETLNPKNVEAARAVFGETKNRTSDAFIFDATFAFDRFAVAALRPVFGDIPMIVMVRNDTEDHKAGDRAKLARVNSALTKAGRPEILQADNLEGVKEFMTVEKNRRVGIGRELRFRAIVDTSDSMAIALREMIPDFVPVNDENFKSFMFQAGEAVRALVASIRAQFATRKSA